MTTTPYTPSDRRPIASRELSIMRRTAHWLAATGLSANAISMTSMVFAAAAGIALAATPYTTGMTTRLLWLAAATGVQLRLLANLLDGMVATESQTASPVGELYNEIPDRIADAVILIGAGFSTGGSPTAGYLAALVAFFVAYLRAQGAVAGARQSFVGPMAKPHRMFLVTVACVYCALTPPSWQLQYHGLGITAATLLLIVAGGLVTALRRIVLVARDLRGGEAGEGKR